MYDMDHAGVIPCGLQEGIDYPTAVACRYGRSRQMVEDLLRKVPDERAHVQRQRMYVLHKPECQKLAVIANSLHFFGRSLTIRMA